MENKERTFLKRENCSAEEAVSGNLNNARGKNLSPPAKGMDFFFGVIIASMLYIGLVFFILGGLLSNFYLILFFVLIFLCIPFSFWKGRKYIAMGIIVMILIPLFLFGSCGLMMSFY